MGGQWSRDYVQCALIRRMAEKGEDLSLPASVVARIIKDALPDGVNVSKEARAAIGKAAGVFILYATACANNFALKGKRKTLAANDVFSALEDMEFQHFIPELKECLEAYKHDQKEKRDAAADRKKKQGPTPGPTGPDQANPLPLVPGTATIPSVIPPMCIDAQAPLDIFGSSGPPSEELMDLEHSLNIPPHPLELI